jgi:hypothetical protein
MREDCTQSLFAGLRTARMDERSVVIAGAALIAALVVVAYPIRWLRLRETKRRMGGCLATYFIMGSPQCQALVQAAFQRSAEAKLAGKAHCLQIEKQLLTALAVREVTYPFPMRSPTPGGPTRAIYCFDCLAENPPCYALSH